MLPLELDLFKKHVRADDFSDDDEILEQYLVTAYEFVVNSTHRTKEELEEIGGGRFPHPLTQAIYLLAGQWYNQREALVSGGMSEPNYSVNALIKMYRKLS